MAAVSALTGAGIGKVWETAQRYRRAMEAAGAFARRRAEQARAALWAEIGEGLLERLRQSPEIARRLPGIEAEVEAGRAAPTVAARRLLDAFLRREGGGDPA